MAGTIHSSLPIHLKGSPSGFGQVYPWPGIDIEGRNLSLLVTLLGESPQLVSG